MTPTSLTDSVFGDLDGQGDCVTGGVIPAGGSYSCSITVFLDTGNVYLPPLELGLVSRPLCIDPNTAHYNVVTAAAVDNEDNEVSGKDDATVTFDNVAPAIEVSKTANPTSVPETGGNVTFTIRVKNIGTVPVTLTGAVDTVFGPIDVGLFDKTYLDAGNIATYSFTAWMVGEPALPHMNVVTVTAKDSQGTEVTGSDDAYVAYIDKMPKVDLTKTANPLTLAEPGGDFTFTLTIRNTSVEPVTITALTDTNTLSAECQSLVGTTLAAGASTTCTYTVTHTEVGTYDNVASVTVQDNDGNTASDTDSATVAVTGQQPPKAYHVFLEKVWVDGNLKPVGAPPLPDDFTITATSSIGEATCTWAGHDLVCIYQNQMPPALDNNGLWVPEGETYTVSETGVPAGWQPIRGIGTFPANGGLCNGTECWHTVKNQSSTGGRVVVTKTVDWSGAQPDPDQTFEFCIFGPSFTSPPYNCRTVGPNGGTIVWDNLLPGRYDVVELPLDAAWIISPKRIQKAYITGANSVELAFANRYDYEGPSLSVEGTCDIQTGQIAFTLTNTGAPMAAGIPYTISNDTGTIASGTTNALDTGASQVFQPPIQIGGGKMIFETTGTGGLHAYAEVEECFTPIEPRGQVQVTKTVDWSGAQPDPNQTFEFCIFGPSFTSPRYNCQTVGPNGGTIVWDNLLPGRYTVVELPLDTAWIVSPSRIQKAYIVGSDTVQLEYTNRYNQPKLSVEGTCDIQTGQITFTLTNTGAPMTAGVPYTITNDTGTIASGTTNALGTGASQVFQPPIQIGGGTMIFETTGTGGLHAYAEVDECFTPIEPRGHLQVTKTVDWSGAQPDPGKSFQICITGPSYLGGDCQTADYDGAVLSWYDLLPGPYTVSEVDPGASWTVTIIGSPAEVAPDQTASATVTNTHVMPNISVTKSANPTSVPETGGNVTFHFVVTNNGAVPVTLTSLTDSVFGNLNGQGDCVTGGLLAAGSSYTCSITQFLASDSLTSHTNVVTAIGTAADGATDDATDDETVTFTNVMPDITVTKTANPTNVPETGGSVTFTFLVANIGVENVTLTSLTDSTFGDLNGQGTCAIGGAIAAGSSYTCSITVWLSGDSAIPHTNTVTAIGTDNDGSMDTATDDETVTFDEVTAYQGCTPGYWRQQQHFGNWSYALDASFDSTFGVNLFDPDITLLEAVQLGGGGVEALARHAVAALLNAANPNVTYPYSVSDVISMVQQAATTGSYEATKNLFETANEAGCPLGRAELPQNRPGPITVQPTIREAPVSDRDGDGVPDNDDKCPAEGYQGYAVNSHGCPLPPPDSDGDGRTDSEDACPAQGNAGYGLDASGCPLPPPDSDGDGLTDNVDACPAQGDAGYGIDTSGCPLPPPDSDGDGLADNVDACPAQGDAGYGLDTSGCPLPPPDSDGDGLADNVDACPAQGDAGYGLDASGCPLPPPDSDGDGLADNVDACPAQGDAGYGLDANGCPLPPPDSDGADESEGEEVVE